MHTASSVSAETFFLDAIDGKRYCLFHPVESHVQCRGTVLMIPPFGEEMNKSRCMLAKQARALAQRGFAILLIDLYGCGDSDGEFRDVSWEIWKDDIALACAWLQRRHNAPISLLAVRFGALLALDFVCSANVPIHRLIMWQPVLNGRQFLTQFYRLQIANAMINANAETSGGTQAIRQLLARGEVVEIAGYEMSSRLSASIDALNVNNFLPHNTLIHWFEVQNDTSDDLPPAKQKIVDYWQQNQCQIQLQKLSGAEFWATQEVSVNTELIGLTSDLLTQSQP